MQKTKVQPMQKSDECQCHKAIFDSVTDVDLETHDRRHFDFRDSSLYVILKPFLNYMRVAGLFFVVKPEDQKKGQAARKSEIFWRVYSTLCIMSDLTAIPFIFLPLFVLGEFNPFVLNQIAYSCWQTQCSSVAIACGYACLDRAKFAQVFRHWEELVWCRHEREKVERGMRRRVKPLLVFALLINVSNNSGWALHVMDPGTFPPEFLDSVPTNLFLFTRVLFMGSHVLATCAWTLPFYLFVMLLLSVQDILEGFNNIVEKALKTIKDDRFPNPANFLLKYKRMIQLVETISSTFGIMLLFKLVMDMLITCLNAHLLLYVCYPANTKFNQVLWAFINLSVLLYLAHISSKVNSLATQAYSKLTELQFSKCSSQNMLQYTSYFYRMTGPTIGISMFGFTVLTRSTVGTLLGTYVSYFILIRQFQEPLPCDDETAFNSTSNSNTF